MMDISQIRLFQEDNIALIIYTVLLTFYPDVGIDLWVNDKDQV